MNLEKVANLAKIAKVNSIFHCNKKDTVKYRMHGFCIKSKVKKAL